MSFQDEGRTFALLALEQYVVRRLDRMSIGRDTLQAIWPVEKWHESRLNPIQEDLERYFPAVRREHYTGRAGLPGFGGFIVSGIKIGRRRARASKSASMGVFVPKENWQAFGLCATEDAPEIPWTAWHGAALLEYNLLLIRVHGSLWSRNGRAIGEKANT
jgi:hypothetical protein